MGSTITLTCADGTSIPAYVATPVATPRGGLVLLQEIFGVNTHIRAVADSYATDGYLVVAPAMFHRVQAGVELGYSPDDVATGVALKVRTEALPPPGPLQDVQAAVEAARSAGKVAVMGYCWGGWLAWRAAEQVPGLAGAVPYYGGGMTTPVEAERTPACPVLAHFGEQDHAIPLAAVQAFTLAQPGVEVHLYPAQHGFNCDQRGAYQAEAAALARQRTLAFLRTHVG
ncbi:dienelactone hydrolase family protein [Rhodoferax sp. TBRC 17660]|uniref:Dienelactone hydrolase family protein n=1 Tax=Rhodoferax potami TaxID=3068338 RepID=A0ABU3KMP1_9BURK|nr:dienelactone hydrolase family protein [Rhodoferax sp. TBRC 17660]MDT7518692.1 dienelactone hydrolase family protein [Rhodoferax sp. TBRC 17660]